MKKIIQIIGVCMLLFSLVLPISIAEKESFKNSFDVEIKISAGYRGKDMGLGVCVKTLNHKTEEINLFVNLTLDYFFQNALDGTYVSNETIIPELPHTQHISPLICYPDGIKFITVTAEEGGISVTRSGISIRNLVILFK